MKVTELLKEVDHLYPNRFSLETKLGWLSEAEASVQAFLKKVYQIAEWKTGEDAPDVPFETIVAVYRDGKRMPRYAYPVPEKKEKHTSNHQYRMVYCVPHPGYTVKRKSLAGATLGLNGTIVFPSAGHPFEAGDTVELCGTETAANNRKFLVHSVEANGLRVRGLFLNTGTVQQGELVCMPEGELLAPLPFCEMYEAYLAGKIAYHYRDMEEYNRAMTRFNRIYERYEQHLKATEPARPAKLHGLW